MELLRVAIIIPLLEDRFNKNKKDFHMKWEDLNTQNRAELIKLYVRNGVTSLDKMKEHYNSFNDGGSLDNGKPPYKKWVKGVDKRFLSDDYNLKAAYNELPFSEMEAWRRNPSANHLPDTYKLPNHITFSEYSVDPIAGMKGGKWVGDKFYPSEVNVMFHPDVYKHRGVPYVEVPYSEKYMLPAEMPKFNFNGSIKFGEGGHLYQEGGDKDRWWWSYQQQPQIEGPYLPEDYIYSAPTLNTVTVKASRPKWHKYIQPAEWKAFREGKRGFESVDKLKELAEHRRTGKSQFMYEMVPRIRYDSSKVRDLKKEIDHYANTYKKEIDFQRDVVNNEFLTDISFRDFNNMLLNYEYLKNGYNNYSKNIAELNKLIDKKYNDNSLVSQGMRYLKRHTPTIYEHLTDSRKDIVKSGDTFTGLGADVINLDNNVIRLTPSTKQSTALFNEFVETTNPSIHIAKDYKDGKIKTFGDSYIPTKNISLFQGVENGKFKAGPIEIFDDNTMVYPVRNIKEKYVSPITKINYNNKENIIERNLYNGNVDFPVSLNVVPDKDIMNNAYEKGLVKKYGQYYIDSEIERAQGFLKGHLNALQRQIKEYGIGRRQTIRNIEMVIEEIDRLRKRRILPTYGDFINALTYNTVPEKVKNESDFYRLQNYFENLNSKKSVFDREFNNTRENSAQINVTDKEGKTYPVSELNASILDNKMVVANPNGGLMVGRFQDMSDAQLDSLNTYLQQHPSWIIRNDLGSFDQYKLDNPTFEDYLKQYFEHPSQDDPNVYAVGTVTPNRGFPKINTNYVNGGPLF